MSDKQYNERKLWYQQPAQKWVEALPIGNGRIGGMVYGDVLKECICLNEDTLWSGRPKESHNHRAQEYLAEVRELIFNGDYGQAQRVIERDMLGSYTESYQPIGNLYIDTDVTGEVFGYSRELDLNKAVAQVSYSVNGLNYQRTMFCSYPDEVMVIRFTCDQPGSINLRVGLDSPHKFKLQLDTNLLTLDGRCPVHVDPNYVHASECPIVYEDDVSYGMRYQVQLKPICSGGSLQVNGDTLVVESADEFTLYVAMATSFNGFEHNPYLEGKDEKKLCANTLGALKGSSYEQIYQRHCQDYQELFHRTQLELGPAIYQDLPTDVWLEQVKNGMLDPALVCLYFDYGRYLLISSSRPGTQPANLQGIWNNHVRPPWSRNYTTNINVEMNYWAAEVCNLAECHEPLFTMIEELAVSGAKTAEIECGCRGWTANHNVDIWRHSTPVGGSARYAYWPMAAPWLVRHLWEHYLFGGDEDFLAEQAYPLIKSAALFCLDWLVEDENGRLVTCPSTSPENDFITISGEQASVAAGSTMDMSLCYDVFTNCIEAAKILNVDREFGRNLAFARELLLPLRIGNKGQLQEWWEDFAEAEPGHRHVSHLYGLYPGNQIIRQRHPHLAEACNNTLRLRIDHGGGHTGWSCAWLINLFARLADGESAYDYVSTLLRRSTYSNLFDAHPPFQIDGNFGGIAGIAEMLLQSHASFIELLPALPEAWPEGSFTGLRARGGFTVDVAWRRSEFASGRIYSTLGNECRIQAQKHISVTCSGELVETTVDQAGVYSFATQRDKVYDLHSEML